MPATFDTTSFRRAVVVLLSTLVVIEFLQLSAGRSLLPTAAIVLVGGGLLSAGLRTVFDDEV